jgi:phospholipase/carboxylesterase
MLFRREGFHRERMNFFAHAVTQRRIDQLMPLDQTLAGKRRRDNQRTEVLAIAFDFQRFADSAGVIVVAPNSRSVTWDLILQDVGFDVAHIDGVLRWVFDHINVDPARLTLAGFSDGATFASWLGLRNGSLFGKLAVFSGCATLPTGRVGTPTIYVTHGRNDTAFPIDDCAQVLVPGLVERGYTTEYLEYDGGHIIPIDVADLVFAWIAGG